MRAVTKSEPIIYQHLRDNELADVERLKADVDYIAMMSGIELREAEENEQEL